MTILNKLLDRLAAGLFALRSAGAIAQAVESGRQPQPAHLRALGIDPRAFATIGHG